MDGKPAYVETAQRLATRGHYLETNSGGTPGIMHPAAVARAVAPLGPDFEAAGWLVDALDATYLRMADLVEAGLPAAVLDAVAVLARAEGESFFFYVLGVASNQIARAVKAASLAHKLQTNPRGNNTAKALWEFARYVLETDGGPGTARELSQLRQRVETLAAALAPFAEYAVRRPEAPATAPVGPLAGGTHVLTVGQCRRAAEVLKEKP